MPPPAVGAFRMPPGLGLPAAGTDRSVVMVVVRLVLGVRLVALDLLGGLAGEAPRLRCRVPSELTDAIDSSFSRSALWQSGQAGSVPGSTNSSNCFRHPRHSYS